MIKQILLLTFTCMVATAVYSQVGINTVTPKATLDITASKTDGTTSEGIIAPRLTGDQIKAKDAKYLAAQAGTLIYATTAVSRSSKKTANITAAGYYYFDGTLWQKIATHDAIDFTASLGNGNGGATNASIAAGGFNTVTLPNVTSNIGGGTWDSANNTYNIPISGTYIIKSTIRLVDGSASRNIFQAVGSSNVDIPEGIWQTNTGNRWTMLYTRIAYFNQGDLLRLYIYSDGAVANLSDASLDIALLSEN